MDWTVNGFAENDLDVNGLQGNGSTKYLDTLCSPVETTFGTQLVGITTYNSTASSVGSAFVGAASAGYANAVVLQCSSTALVWDCPYQGAAGRLIYSTASWAGYTSANRTALNDQKIYVARNSYSHSQVGSNTTVVTQATNDNTLNVFRSNYTANFLYTNARLSFVAFHRGLTEAESNSLYLLVAALRTELGGGLT